MRAKLNMKAKGGRNLDRAEAGSRENALFPPKGGRKRKQRAPSRSIVEHTVSGTYLSETRPQREAKGRETVDQRGKSEINTGYPILQES